MLAALLALLLSSADDPVTMGSPTVEPASWAKTRGLAVGVETSDPTIEFLINAQLKIKRTGDPGQYEKAAILAICTTEDPSPPGSEHDCVGVDGRGQISGGNPLGRAWGGYFEGLVRPGSDGIAQGIEVALFNYGSDQPFPSTRTSKAGTSINVYGGNGTAALNIMGNNCWEWGAPAACTFWHTGIYSEPSSIGLGGFILLRDRFRVDRAGSVQTAGYVATHELLGAALVDGDNHDLELGGTGFLHVGSEKRHTVTGFAGGWSGRQLVVLFDGPGQVTLANDAGSRPENRILTLTGTDVRFPPGSRTVRFIYVAAHRRWLLER